MKKFIKKISNIIENKQSVELRFLSLLEQNTINNYVKDKTILTMNGGYPESELKRATFFNDSVDNIICIRITYDKRYLSLTHQNILGTLLSLSITRDSIGDILPAQGVFFATKELQKEIFYSFKEISNVPIKLEVIEPTSIHSETKLDEMKFTSESLRLDLIVSKITKLSRRDSNILIERDLVKVNHLITTKNTKILKEFDILSIRKYGRFIILDTKNTSKKGKIIVKYGKYV